MIEFDSSAYHPSEGTPDTTKESQGSDGEVPYLGSKDAPEEGEAVLVDKPNDGLNTTIPSVADALNGAKN